MMREGWNLMPLAFVKEFKLAQIKCCIDLHYYLLYCYSLLLEKQHNTTQHKTQNLAIQVCQYTASQK